MKKRKLSSKFLLALNAAAKQAVEDGIQEYLDEGHTKKQFYELCLDMPDWLDTYELAEKYLSPHYREMWFRLNGMASSEKRWIESGIENDMTGFTTGFTYFYSLKKCQEWGLHKDDRYSTYLPLYDNEGELLNEYHLRFDGTLCDSEYDDIE